MNRLLLLLLLLPLGQLALAAACELEGEPIVLSIQDFGSAYFKDFTLDAGRNSAEFRNGVCLHAPDESWVVKAASIDITGLQPGSPISVSASDATLLIPQWFMTAAELTSDGQEFVIRGGTFTGTGLSGTVEQVVFNLESGVIDGRGLVAEGPGYRLTGESALFQDDLLTLQVASVTTCKCPGKPPYLLTGSEASVSLLADGAVTLLGGELQLGFLQLALGEEFVITNDTLSELSPPFMIGWDPAQEGEDPRGHGLTLTVPPFNLNEETSLEFGVSGIDRNHPLSGHLLLDVATEFTDLLVGYTKGGGPVADFSVRERLNDHLLITVGSNNRHYSQQSFLHEGYLTLATTFPALQLEGGARVAYGASLTVAASSQIRSGESVVSPRLRSALHLDWRLPTLPPGDFSLRADYELSRYSQGREQYGFRLRPGWRRNFGPLLLSLDHDWRLTNAGSPFSSTLDLLSPINRTVAAARVTDVNLASGASLNASLGVTWNWLRFADGSHRGFENLLLAASVDWQAGDWLLRPAMRLQLAGLLDPRESSDRLAFIEGSFDADSGDVELGVLARYHLGGKHQDLEILELSAAYPLDIENLRLIPFLALDFAPLLVADGGSLLSGHGLEVLWDSCCGLFNFGYRVHAGEFTTTLSAEFIR